MVGGSDLDGDDDSMLTAEYCDSIWKKVCSDLKMTTPPRIRVVTHEDFE